MTDCPVPGCVAVREEDHTCGFDAIERHAFDAEERDVRVVPGGVRLMEMGETQSWVWLAFTEMQIDAAHQQKEPV